MSKRKRRIVINGARAEFLARVLTGTITGAPVLYYTDHATATMTSELAKAKLVEVLPRLDRKAEVRLTSKGAKILTRVHEAKQTLRVNA